MEDNSSESSDGEEMIEDEKKSITAIENEVCQCLNKEPKDDDVVVILSSCNRLIPGCYWLSDEKKVKIFSLEDIHVHNMAYSIYVANKQKMSWRLRSYLTRLMCMKMEYPFWRNVASFAHYRRFKAFFGKVQATVKLMAEGKAQSVCTLSALRSFLKQKFSNLLLETSHSTAGFKFSPDHLMLPGTSSLCR
jgi:hypothetical protein